MGIRGANKDYERWLRAELKGDLVEADLERKHKKMCKGPFEFLRATYWRWAEEILDVCPELADAPTVLAVGDIHLENFGTWRDVEGRLIWGVNDYDEAAEMPYMLDLVRLASSAVLAQRKQRLALRDICANILDGYEQGLAVPEPFVLDREHMWLRKRFVESEAGRAEFWNKFDLAKEDVCARPKPEQPQVRYLKVITGALPEEGIALTLWRRSAGTGNPWAGRAGSRTGRGVAGPCYGKRKHWFPRAGPGLRAGARSGSASATPPRENIVRPIRGTSRTTP